MILCNVCKYVYIYIDTYIYVGSPTSFHFSLGEGKASLPTWQGHAGCVEHKALRLALGFGIGRSEQFGVQGFRGSGCPTPCQASFCH